MLWSKGRNRSDVWLRYAPEIALAGTHVRNVCRFLIGNGTSCKNKCSVRCVVV